MIDGQLVVNPTLPESRRTSKLDLIVVGTKDGLTMVEAGADEVPEEQLLEALDLAHAEIKKLCEAQEELRRQAGKPKWLDAELTEELEAAHGDRIRERIAAEGLREAAAVVDELAGRALRRAHDGLHRGGHRPPDAGARRASTLILERHPPRGREGGPVREQFESDLRALTEAEQDSKELKSAKRQLLFDRIIDDGRAAVPGRPAPSTGDEPHRQGLADQAVRQEGGRGDLQGARPPQDRGRQAPPRRPRHGGDPPDRRARSASRRARTARPSSRAGRRRS